MIDIYQPFVEDFNNFLLKCFARCGYSEEYVMSHINEFSIEAQNCGLHDWYNMYKHGDKALFGIHQYLDYESCSIKSDVIFYEEKK